MAILKIARMGHPVLRGPAEPVADPTAPDIRRLVKDMVDSMGDAGGVGLAAPQVHVPKRLVIFHVPETRARVRNAEGGVPGIVDGDPTDGPVPFTVLINPGIEVLGEDMDLGWEACLSVPGLTGLVPRYARIRYTGVTPAGDRVERIATGFHARVVQHECDHLDGILYPRRMTDLATLGFVEETQRYPLPASSQTDPET